MDEPAATGSRPPAARLELPAAAGRRLSLDDLVGTAVLVSFLSHAA